MTYSREDFDAVEFARCIAEHPKLTVGKCYYIYDTGITWIDVQHDEHGFDGFDKDLFEPVDKA